MNAQVDRNPSHPQSGERAPPRAQRRLMRWLWQHRGSLCCVFLPTFLAALYYFFIAADLFASEASYVVRSPSHTQLSGLAGLIEGGGITHGSDDIYSVQDFVVSRDALAALQKKIDLRALFSRPEADFIAHYPNLIDRNNEEDFFRYYKRFIDVSFDTTTGISTLQVKAFRSEDAQRIAQLLLDESEVLVNRLNERARQNSVKYAEADIRDAEQQEAEAQQNLLAYRKREALIDPSKTSGAIFDTLSKMQAERSNTLTRLAELQHTSADSPLVAGLRSHVDALDREIETQRSRLAGPDGSMAPKISEYEQLALREQFASKLLSSSLASLEAARAEGRRQQIYLDRVVDADLPDKALYPKRILSVLIVFVSFFMAYSMGKLLIAGVREHEQH